jgi:predicted short-subunit dehydrogenase-like oxidoreductase (DUF2520 family)
MTFDAQPASDREEDARRRSGRLGIGIVGAGRVGPVIGAALAGAGHAVVGISAISESSRERAEAMLHGVPILDVPAIAIAAGVIPLAIHPAVSFTGTTIDIAQLVGAYFAVTAPGPVQPIGQALVVEMGGEPIIIAEEDRPAYAEAIATATSFSSAIVDQATNLLASIGIETPGAVLGPLVRSSVENALRRRG